MFLLLLPFNTGRAIVAAIFLDHRKQFYRLTIFITFQKKEGYENRMKFTWDIGYLHWSRST